MKMNLSLWKCLPWVAGALLGCALNLPAQTPPTITTQPASQTNVAGTNVTFTVAVAGTGPFTYQWQFNGVNLPNNIMSTIAGTNSYGYYGDGGLATSAELYNPYGVALDAAGNVYIADAGNSRIRKVGANGVITTVAGTNSAGYSGDGGAAINASLHDPMGVAVDSAGDLYIADNGNNRIRKVGANGIITTVAGTNSDGYSGDGGAAINAKLFVPTGVAVDGSGNLYIADQGNSRIRKVGTNGVITTVAGTNAYGFSGDGGAAINAQLNFPFGVTVDPTGQLFIGDSANGRIRKVDTNGVITTVAGGGTGGDGGAATNASLHDPCGLALDAFGDLLIADVNNYRIRMVGTNGIINTVAGNVLTGYNGDGGAPTKTSLGPAYGLAVDPLGNIYIADTSEQRIRKALLDAGYPTLILNNVSVFSAGNYSVVVSNSYGVVTSAVATLAVAAPPVITFQPPGQMMVLVQSSPVLSVVVAGSGPFGYLCYMAGTNLVQTSTNGIFTLPAFSATNAGDYTVVITNAWGSVTSQVATLTAAYPPSVTTSPSNQTVIGGNNMSLSVAVGGTGPFSYQWQFNGTNLPGSIITTVAGTNSGGNSGDGGPAIHANLSQPWAVAWDGLGNLFLADSANNRVRKVDTNGIITTVAGNGTPIFAGDVGPATNACLNYPIGLALDAADNLYIADLGNHRMRKVASNGVITTVAGNGSAAYSGDGGAATNAGLPDGGGLASDVLGNLYIADPSCCRIRKVGTNGIISTVAGNGSAAFTGDGGLAVNAGLVAPSAVALDASGDLFIADALSQRIREVDANGVISTVAGNGMSGYSGDGGAATRASLEYPYGLSFDASGNLYIADMHNNRIRKVNANGIITTVAGNGFDAPFAGMFSGDGGAATNASLYYPGGVAVNSSGNLYIADTYNYRIREVNFAGNPSLAITNASGSNAGSYTVVVTSPYGSVTSAVATVTVEAAPVITVQPTNQFAPAGSSPTFSVTAAGSGTFEYLWYLGWTNLVQSGRSSSLTLPNVFTNNAGKYTVVVINTWGSVTSAVATLTVTIPNTPPQIVTGDGCCGFLDNQFGFNLSGAYGQTIVVDGSTDLVNWTPLMTNTCVGDGGSAFYFWDPCCTNFGSRFYRARVP
jgi:sugar lactone lactonase YvrE